MIYKVVFPCSKNKEWIKMGVFGQEKLKRCFSSQQETAIYSKGFYFYTVTAP